MSKLKKRMLKIRNKMKDEDLSIDNDLRYAEAETKYIESFDDMKFEESAKRQLSHKRSPRILTLFTKEQRDAIVKIVSNMRETNLNKRAQQIKDLLGPEFPELGTGTNRITFLKDGYAIKIALDKRGCIDNMSEYKRAPEAPEYLAKTYEVYVRPENKEVNGLILVAEYVTLFDQTEFENNKDALKTILDNLSQKYIMKDLGLTAKNYCNWGYRDNGTIVSLDYAYMYPIRGNENALRCNCGSLIVPNKTFTGYECSNSKCGLKYSAMEITARIRTDLMAEEDREIIEIANASDGENKFIKVEGISTETTSSAVPFGLDINKPIDELIDDAFNAICKSSTVASNAELVRRFKGLMRELDVINLITDRWKISKFDDLDIQINDAIDDTTKAKGKSLTITNNANGLSEEYATDPDTEESFSEVKKSEIDSNLTEKPSLLKAMESGDDVSIDDSDAEKRAQKILEALSDEKDEMDKNISIDEWMGVTSLYNQMMADGKSDDE